MYVIDLSGSTLHGPGCGGDRNHDGRADTPLDCEIAAATALNAQAVENGTVGEVGLVGFAGGAVTADLSADDGVQALTAPDADGDADGTPDVVEALQSAHSAGRIRPVGFRQFTPVTTTTETTTFSAGITAACQIMDETDNPNRLVVFLSDGGNSSGDPVASVLPCDATAVIHTFAVGADASCEEESELGGLQEIADLTDGRVHHGGRPDAGCRTSWSRWCCRRSCASSLRWMAASRSTSATRPRRGCRSRARRTCR